MKTMFGRALAAMLVLCTATAARASSIPGGSSGIAGGNCAGTQFINGLSTAGVPNCASTPLPVTQFISPINSDGTLSGTTVFSYSLPSTTTGRLIFTAIGNGGAGGSGGVNNSVIRTGGGGGGSGMKRQWWVSVPELLSKYPTLTTISVNFGSLGTPGPAQSTASTAGTGGTNSSVIYLQVNNTAGTNINAISPGGAGGAGAASGVAGGGGLAGGAGQTAGAASAAAGTQSLVATDAGFGPSGAGAGGGVTAANAESMGGLGGNALDNPYSTKISSSAAVETSAVIANNPYYGRTCIAGLGGGGGGSSASTTVPGGNGAAGSGYGAPGGGGGAGTNGSSSGAGGAATYGCVEITYAPF